MRKIKAGILGISSRIGQLLINLLESHPFIDLTELADTKEYSGSRLKDLDIWKISERIPPYVKSLVITDLEPNLQCDLVILCPVNVNEIENTGNKFADYNYPVIKTFDPFEQDRMIPEIIPEVNSSHLKLLKIQKKERFRKKGFIISGSDIITFCVSMISKPFIERFNLQSINLPSPNPEFNDLVKSDVDTFRERLQRVLGKFHISQILPSDMEINLNGNPEHSAGKTEITMTLELNKPVKEQDPDSIFKILNSSSLDPAKYSVPSNIINHPVDGLKKYLTQDRYFSLLDIRKMNDRSMRIGIGIEDPDLISARALIVLAEFLIIKKYI